MIRRLLVVPVLVAGTVAVPSLAAATPLPLPTPGAVAPALVVPSVPIAATTAPDLVKLLTGGAAKVVTDATGTVNAVVSATPVAVPVPTVLKSAISRATATATTAVAGGTATSPTSPTAPVAPVAAGSSTTAPGATSTGLTQQSNGTVTPAGVPAAARADDPQPPTLFELLAQQVPAAPAAPATTAAPSTTDTSGSLALTGLGFAVPLLGAGAVAAAAAARRRSRA